MPKRRKIAYQINVCALYEQRWKKVRLQFYKIPRAVFISRMEKRLLSIDSNLLTITLTMTKKTTRGCTITKTILFQ